MTTNKSDLSSCTNRRWTTSLALALLFALLALKPALADTAPQRSYASADAAVKALESAAKANDQKALESILGRDAGQIISSGDPVADNNAREDFVRRYNEMHRLAFDDKGRVILYIGWPAPRCPSDHK